MKNIKQLVNANFVQNIKSYDILAKTVYELLHLNPQKHKLWVVVKQQHLTLLTDNPYLGTQLRYQQQTICTTLNQRHLLQLKTVKIKIVPPTRKPMTDNEPCFRITDKAKANLDSIANIIDDEGLKQALKKLAQSDTKE